MKASGPTWQPGRLPHWTANFAATEVGRGGGRGKDRKRHGGGITGVRRRGGRRCRWYSATAEGEVLQGLPLLLLGAQVPRLQPHLRRDPPLHPPRSQTLTRCSANLQSTLPISATQSTNLPPFECKFVSFDKKNSGFSYA